MNAFSRCCVLQVTAVLIAIAGGAAAAPLHSLDLDSLALRAEVVVEGDVTAAKRVEWSNVLTVKVSTAFAGNVKAGESIDVWLGGVYRKHVKAAPLGERRSFTIGGDDFAAGERMILFLRPVKSAAPADRVVYEPALSGVKVVADGQVTGMSQIANPGPFANTVPEGDVAPFREKVAKAVEWAVKFRAEFAAKKSEPKWLLEALAQRPPLFDPPAHGPEPAIARVPLPHFRRDEVACDLCLALAATNDQAAIRRAKELRSDRYEQRLLDGWTRSP